METNKLKAKVMKKIIFYITIIIVTFSGSLLFMPYEFFLVTALIVLLFLNAIEKELNRQSTKPQHLERFQKLQNRSRFENSRISKLLQ